MCGVFAFVHTLAHLSMAVVLMLILEVGIYTCIKCDRFSIPCSTCRNVGILGMIL